MTNSHSFSTLAKATYGLQRACLWLLPILLVLFVSRFAVNSAAMQTPAAFSSVSAASFETNLTPEGIAAGFGSNLAPSNATATTTPLPTTLNTISVTVNGVNAGLFFVSAGQINYQVPLGTAIGEATVNVLRNGAITHTGKLNVVSAAPAIFTANSNGIGVPAAIILRVAANGAQTTETIAQLVNNRWATKAINLGPTGERVFLILFLCGVRGLPNSDGNSGNGVAENARVLMAGVEITPTFANKQGGLVGVDQVNVEIPRSLIGRGKVKFSVMGAFMGAGLTSNEAEVELAGESGANPPSVASFAPALATAGETINVNGSNFSATAANNVVIIGGNETRNIESASATQLIARVPFGVEAGNVTVRTTQGDGTSASAVSIRTSVSGVATDTQLQPLAGARVRVIGSSINATVQADGSFVLKDAPTGTRGVEIDPTSLPLTPAMPKYQTLLGVTGNRDNYLGEIKLQPPGNDGVSIQTSTGSSDAENAPPAFNQAGLLLAPTVPAGQVTAGGVIFSLADNAVATFPAGTTGNKIYLTILANSQTPAKLPTGIFSTAIAQLTPFGVQLAPGGKLTFPNPDGLPANAQARLYKLDQTSTSTTLGQFIEAGTANVSADGQRIETAANAITETSIYFAALARPLTTVIGRVVDSDNVTPVRRALISVRGQLTLTDGNGGFLLRNVPVPANNLLTLEAGFIRPTGRVDRIKRSNIPAVAGGLTRVTPDLVLPSPTTLANRPPTLIAPPLLTIIEGQTRDTPLVVSDPDTNQTVQVTVSGAAFASIVQVQGVTVLRLVPGAGTAGNYTLVLKATDNLGASVTQNIALTVSRNRPPVLVVPGPQTGVVGQALAFNVSGLELDEGQTLTFTADRLPAGATFSQTSANTGRFLWTPSANQGGSVTVGFTLTDNGSPVMSDTKTVTITIGGGTTAQWTQTAGPEGAAVRSLLVNGSNVFAGTQGGLFRSTNDGVNWTPANNGLTGQFITSLAAIGTTLFAGTASNGVYRSTDNGVNWAPDGLGSQNVLSLGVNGSALYAGTASGVYRITDNGANWTLANNGLSTQRVYAFAALGNNLFAGTLTAGVFRSPDNGANWTAVNNGLFIPSVSSLAVIGTTLFAGTSGGGVFRTADSGANWVPAINGMGPQAISALTVRGTTLFAGTLLGSAFRSTDSGASWTAINNGLSNQFIYALAASSTALFAGSNNGVFRSTDNGANWAAANTGLNGQFVFALAVNGSTLLAGTIGGAFRTTDNGAKWTAVNTGLSNQLILSMVVSGTTVFAGTGGNGVFHTTNNGDTWTPVNNGISEEDVTALALSGTTLLAGTQGGGIFRSTNNGANWTPINTGLGSPDILSLAVNGTTLFAATNQSGVFRSTDGGNNWTAANNGLSSLVTYALGVNGATVFAGTANGLFRSTDNGATWTAANTGLAAGILAAAFVANGQSFYVGTGFGGVYRTTTNGTLWTPINEGLTNLLVKALVVSGNNLVAGTVGSSVFSRPLQ